MQFIEFLPLVPTLILMPLIFPVIYGILCWFEYRKNGVNVFKKSMFVLAFAIAIIPFAVTTNEASNLSIMANQNIRLAKSIAGTIAYRDYCKNEAATKEDRQFAEQRLRDPDLRWFDPHTKIDGRPLAASEAINCKMVPRLPADYVLADMQPPAQAWRAKVASAWMLIIASCMGTLAWTSLLPRKQRRKEKDSAATA